MNVDQKKWDASYAKVERGEQTWTNDDWLSAWIDRIPDGKVRRALDIGCGPGTNAKLLLDHGFEVSAFDLSSRAVALCRAAAPEARIVQADIREGLPFGTERYELIVADLSLHYFPWDMTHALIDEIAHRLVPEGLFAGRFNSMNDAKHGAEDGVPSPSDPNLRIIQGRTKRFFMRTCFDSLFGAPWQVEALAEKTTNRFDNPKVLWEIIARRRANAQA